LIDIDNFFNNDVITSSLVTNLSSSAAQEINCKLGYNCRWVRLHHRRDSCVASAVCIGL